MCVLDHQVCTGFNGMADYALVQRVVPDGGGRDNDTVGSERFCEFFEMSRVVANYFVARLLERWRVEKPVAAQVLVVIANEQFELCARAFREPGGTMHSRLLTNGGIDHGKDF
jgi:hypothetical protein